MRCLERSEVWKEDDSILSRVSGQAHSFFTRVVSTGQIKHTRGTSTRPVYPFPFNIRTHAYKSAHFPFVGLSHSPPNRALCQITTKAQSCRRRHTRSFAK